MNYRQKCPTMCVGFLFTTDLSAARETEGDERRARVMMSDRGPLSERWWAV